MNELEKRRVLDQIAAGQRWRQAQDHGRSKWFVGDHLIHMRFVTRAANGVTMYAYNINPNTLKADYEVWICGGSDFYYLIPISIIREIYRHPTAYVDYQSPQRRVAHIDTASHECRYSTTGPLLNFRLYFHAILKPPLPA